MLLKGAFFKSQLPHIHISSFIFSDLNTEGDLNMKLYGLLKAPIVIICIQLLLSLLSLLWISLLLISLLLLSLLFLYTLMNQQCLTYDVRGMGC